MKSINKFVKQYMKLQEMFEGLCEEILKNFLKLFGKPLYKQKKLIKNYRSRQEDLESETQTPFKRFNNKLGKNLKDL